MEHPKYNDNTDEYDIGLLFLENSTAIDISLPFLNYDNLFPEPGSTAHSMGWGDTDAGDNLEFPDELMVVDLHVISNEQCEKAEEGGKAYKNWIFDDSEFHSARSGAVFLFSSLSTKNLITA